MEPFELKSERVLLSMPVRADIDRITELCQDPAIQDGTTVPSPYTRADAETFVNTVVAGGWANATSLIWAIREPLTGRLDGTIGVTLTGDGLGEIGFWTDPKARGRGLTSHAVRLVAERVLNHHSLGLTHLVWWAYVGNWASRRVAWATGFRHEGLVRGGQPQRGKRRDAWVATLCAGDPMTPASRWLDAPVIRGERVTLRPLEDTDAGAVAEACSDPQTQYWLSGLPSPYTIDDAVNFIHSTREDAASGRIVHWAAVRPEGGPSIGTFGLRLFGHRNDQGSIGYHVHPSARGRGIASEATQMVIRHAFLPTEDGGLGLRRLIIEHAEGNEGSRKVIERAGFRYIGAQRADLMRSDGSTADHHRYDLLPTDLA
ncbi:GNAT family N-acetyltransferase [Phytoactinopolyspora mesophila]|nr:GNAT family N-acetyltransferase [Phytoactinopolyspora mesophila]